jgi:hypothetical protein
VAFYHKSCFTLVVVRLTAQGEVVGSKPGLCILQSILPVHRGTRQSACGTRPLACMSRDPPVSPAGPACHPSGTRPSACMSRDPLVSHGTRSSAQVDQLRGLPMGPTWQVDLGPTRQPCSQTRPWDPPVSHGARLPGPLDPRMSGNLLI